VLTRGIKANRNRSRIILSVYARHDRFSRTDCRRARDPGRSLLYEGGEGKGAPLIGVRLPADELAAVDDQLSGQREPLSRPEAIRRLIKIALKKPRKS
jgi:hypothetical protein